MAVYRVGDAGATVFSTDGEPMCTLRPGQVVVPGSVDAPGSLAHRHMGRRGAVASQADNEQVRTKRLRGYDDKRLHPAAGDG